MRIYNILIVLLVVTVLLLTITNIRHKNEIKELVNSQVIIYGEDTVHNIIQMIQPEENIAFIPVKINGVETVMMLDTGAGKSIIDFDQINEFGLELNETDNKIHGVGGSNLNWEVINCSSIEIGGIKYRAKLTVSDISNVVDLVDRASGIRIGGVIGSDFMNYNSAVIDFKTSKFFLVSK